MPKAGSCTICVHPECAAIDDALHTGASLQAVANRYGTSKASVHRHTQHTIPQAKDHPLLAEAQRLHQQALAARDMVGWVQVQVQVQRAMARLLVRLCEAAEDASSPS